MARRQLKAPRFSGLRFTLLIIALCCLLAVAAIGCGPSEQEIEATVAAGIRATATAVAVKSTAPAVANLPTAIANLPTPTPVIESPAGLQLPSRLRPSPVPHRKMSLEEARRMYREMGCTGCSTRLQEAYDTYGGSNRKYHVANSVEVLMGEFTGNDNLPDAILLIKTLEFYIYDRSPNWSASYLAIPLTHNGVSLDHNLGRNKAGLSVGKKLPANLAGVYGSKEGVGRNLESFFTDVRYSLSAYDEQVYLLTYYGRGISLWNLVTRGLMVDHKSLGSMFGDFDNDNEIEIGVLREDSGLRIIESDIMGTNDEATETISLAAKDFASNLLTTDTADFEALWREHRPSASVAALALILEMPFHSLLDDLYAAVDNGEDLRETVLAVRQSRR